MATFGIHYAFWGRDWDVDLLQRIAFAAEIGFDVIEITPPEFMTRFDRAKMDELKACAEKHGIEMSFCIGFPKEMDMASVDASVRRAGIAYAGNMLKAVHYVGGKILGGILYSYWPSDYSHPVDKQGAWERGLQSVREVIKTAEDLDILYAIEMVNRFEQFVLNSVEEGRIFVSQVDSPKCRLLLDVFHMSIEEDNLAQAILDAGNMLAHMHICQNNRKIPAPGGLVDWISIVQALKKISFSGRLVMEPFVLTGGPVGHDLRIWRDLIPDTTVMGLNKELSKGLTYIKSLF